MKSETEGTYQSSLENGLIAGNTVRKFLTFLMVLIFLPLLFGCQEKVLGLDEFELLLNSSDTSTEETEAFAKNIYVIIPENSSAELSMKAKELCEKINSKTQINTILKYDNESISLAEGDIELLAGYTNHIVSQEMLQSLKLGDYICKWNKGKIVLGGRYENATITAIDDFCEKILHGASNSCLMGEDACIEHFESYQVSMATINGYDLYDYNFVYFEENKNCEKEIAETLRKYVAEKSGYWLPVIDNKSVDYDTARKFIFVGSCSGGEEYDAIVRSVDGGIAILGKTSYDLSLAAASFAQEMFKEISNGNAAADFSESVKIISPENSFDFSFVTIKNKDCYSEEYLKNALGVISQAITKSNLTIIHISDDTASDIEKLISRSYEHKQIYLEGKEKLVAVYKKGSVEECNLQKDYIDIRLSADENAYRIAIPKELSSDAETNQQISSVLSDERYNFVLTDVKDENNRFEGIQLLSTASESYRFGEDVLYKSLYMDNGLVLKEITSVPSNGTDAASLVLYTKVVPLYSKKYIDLAKSN